MSSSNRILEGKIALVTGASRGIGAATCANLASKGCSLIMNYTSDSSADKCRNLAQSLEQKHSIKTLCVQADMGSTTGPAHIISAALKDFPKSEASSSSSSSGNTEKPFQIDIIVNNAGVAAGAPIQDTDVDQFADVYNVNVRGPLLLMQAAFAHLPHDRSGRVVNVSSVSSSCGFAGQSVYGGTKGALESMTKVWARELAERATVNAVNPGPVATDMYGSVPREFEEVVAPWNKNTPLAAVRKGVDADALVERADFAGGRPAYDYEIAGIIAMLCTPDSGWCTGSTVCANGGMRWTS